jgi:hypothetical protein
VGATHKYLVWLAGDLTLHEQGVQDDEILFLGLISVGDNFEACVKKTNPVPVSNQRFLI